MADNPYSVGDRVLVSRAQNGEDHEEAVVRDAHVLLIGEETRPIVVAELADGERLYLTATKPNVLPLPVAEVEEDDDDLDLDDDEFGGDDDDEDGLGGWDSDEGELDADDLD